MLRLFAACLFVASLAGCAQDADAPAETVTQTVTVTEAPPVVETAPGNASVRIYCFCFAFSAVLDNGDDVWWLRGFNIDLDGNASWVFDWEGAAPLNVTARDLNMTVEIPGELVSVKVGVGSPSTCNSGQGAVSVAIKRGGRPTAIMSDSSGCPTVRLQG